MELVIDHENAAINAIVVEKTAAHWQDSPEFSALIEHTYFLDDASVMPNVQYLMKLVRFACQSDEEQSFRVFLLLQSYCAVVEPSVVAQVLARFIMEEGEPYPNLPTKSSGWLTWSLDYKPELVRKGEMVRRLWTMAKGRGEDIEQLAIQLIVSAMVRKQEAEKDAMKQRKEAINTKSGDYEQGGMRSYNDHSIVYMLHCGPLADQGLMLWHEESIVNALVRMNEGQDPRAIENQQLILVNLLDRFFLWMDLKDDEECVEQLKLRISSHTKTPELLQFAMNAIIRFQDGRWVPYDTKDEGVRTKVVGLSLLEMNRDREPMHYRSADQAGNSFGFSESRNAIKGKPLREREIPRKHGRAPSVQAFEIGDLVTQCMTGHELDSIEQLLRSLIMHIGMRVDTAMVSVTPAAMKHAAQQRDKILLRLMAETPLYRRIMTSAMEQARRSAAAICLPVIQGMLRCCIAHWDTCKNTSQQAYPKELEEAIWVAQLAEKTGLIPAPINQAVVLFPLIYSKDIGLLLEQCYYILLVRNADVLQHPQPQRLPPLPQDSLEVLLITRLIFKHAERTVHLLPLFTT